MICPRINPKDVDQMTIYPQPVKLAILQDHYRYFTEITLKNGSSRYMSIHEAAIAVLLIAIPESHVNIVGDRHRFDPIFDQDWDVPDAETLLTLFMNRVPLHPWFQ